MTPEGDGALAPPPFNAEEALPLLKRALRDLKLVERGAAFELRGKRVLELKVDAASITARLARKLALTPEWDTLAVRSSTDQRKFLDELRKRLARWEHED
ncbi:MAG: hypothetical protein Q8K96_13255 [Rubrivivax sp.]|nr:hypothetical protein [Rubrivivax sp.]